MRGLAILMVLDYHAPVHWISYPLRRLGFPNFGWAGVDLFFVLSGFLVGGLLIKEWRTRGTIDHRRFLIRRGFKIWPQYYVFLALMLLSGHRSLHLLWGNLLNIQNYVGGIPHTWSLAVEEHAYLVLALGLSWAALAKIRARTVGWVLTAVCASVVVGRLLLIEHGYEVVNRTHTRIEGILYGVLLAMVFHHRPETFRRWQARWWVWAGLAAATVTLFRFQTDAPWSASVGWDAADLFGIALLMLLYRPGRRKRRSFPYRAIAWVGVYSYGIYLWHVAVIAPALAISRNLPHVIAPFWVALAPTVGGIALGAVFTRIVELPTLALRDRLFPRPVDSPVGASADARRPRQPTEAQKEIECGLPGAAWKGAVPGRS